MTDADDSNTRRRVPRRDHSGNVGVLFCGTYSVEKTVQVGEGGISILFPFAITVKQNLLVTFKIPGGSLICAKGSVSKIESASTKGHLAIEIEFSNLDFHFKRELRNFVARATQENFGTRAA